MAQFAARATRMMPGLILRVAGAERPLPLDTVAPDHAAAASRLCRRRAPLPLRVAGRDATLSAIGCSADTDHGLAQHAVQLSIDGRGGELRLPRPLLDLLLGAL